MQQQWLVKKFSELKNWKWYKCLHISSAFLHYSHLCSRLLCIIGASSSQSKIVEETRPGNNLTSCERTMTAHPTAIGYSQQWNCRVWMGCQESPRQTTTALSSFWSATVVCVEEKLQLCSIPALELLRLSCRFTTSTTSAMRCNDTKVLKRNFTKCSCNVSFNYTNSLLIHTTTGWGMNCRTLVSLDSR